MGHQIVYCGRCGSGIRHDEFDRGRAVMVEMIAYCSGCVPADTSARLAAQRELPTATPRRAQPVVRSESNSRLSPGTSRRTRPGVGLGPWIGGGTAALIVLAGLAFFSSGSPEPRSDPRPSPVAGRTRPVTAPAVEAVDTAGPSRAVAELLAFEKAGGDPDAVLLRCDQARPLVKGTPAERTLRDIEQRAAAEKTRRDRERQFETALRNVMELIGSRHAAEREKEVFALLAAAAEIAGPRKAEVVALETRYREILKKAAETPEPAPPPDPAPVAPSPALEPPAPPPGLLLFQDGRYPTPGYRGTSDTALFEASPDKTRGESTGLDVDGDNPSKSGKDSIGLLRWDLSAVAPGTRIVSAEVVVRVGDSSRSTYQVYALVRSWSEGEATWTRASAVQAWEIPGGRGATDRRPEPVGRLASARGTSTFVLDTARVQEWIDRPATNHGIMFDAPDSSDGMVLRSREWGVAAERPMLRLTVAEGPTRVVFKAGIAEGFARMEGGTPTPEGLLVPPKGVFSSWRAFSTPVTARTRLRFRVKPSFDVQEAYVISWCEKRKANARHWLRGLQKDTWTDVDLALAEFRFGFNASDPRFEGELMEGFRIHFTGGPETHFLVERIEIVEAGT